MKTLPRTPLTVMGGGIAPRAILKHVERHKKDQDPQTQMGGGIAPRAIIKHAERHAKDQKKNQN